MRLATLRQQYLRGDAEFAELAKEHSQSSTRFHGGILGNVREGSYPEPVNSAIVSLQEGEVSEILESELGVMMFHVERVLPAQPLSTTEIRERVAGQLKRTLVEESWKRFEAEMAERAAPRSLRTEAPSPRTSARASAFNEPLRPQTTPSSDDVVDDGPDDVIVESAHGPLTRATIEAELGGSSIRANPGRTQNAIDALIRRRALSAEFERLGLELPQATRRNLFWRSETVLYLEALTREVQRRMKPPTESALRDYFSRNRDRFKLQPHSLLRWVQLERSPPLIASYQRAVREFERLQDFDTMAVEHCSACKEALLAQTQLISWFGIDGARAIGELEVGERSGLVTVAELSSYFVFELAENHQERLLSFDEARAQVESAWSNERAQVLRDQVLDEAVSSRSSR